MMARATPLLPPFLVAAHLVAEIVDTEADVVLGTAVLLLTKCVQLFGFPHAHTRYFSVSLSTHWMKQPGFKSVWR